MLFPPGQKGLSPAPAGKPQPAGARSFANLLLAVFHLTEELTQRQDLGHLTPGDREHLAGDIERAYVALIAEWLDYMQHLQKNYPYLFSLAWRINPFDPEASAVIE